VVDTTKIHPLLKQPVQYREWLRGLERPRDLYNALPDDMEPVLALAGHHIVSARQFDRAALLGLCRLAAFFESMPRLHHNPLQDNILISAFYEPSTRTRISFESAWHRLGGTIMSITDPSTTGIAKGESLEDVAEMFSNYGDLMVLRDNKNDSVYKMLETLRIPIVNAGNGTDEHPTQALSDLYAIFKWQPELAVGGCDPVKIGIIGTPNKMRTVRSLLLLLSLISERIVEVYVINPEDDAFDPDQREELERGGLTVHQVPNLEVLPELDIVYINAIAWIGKTYESLTGDLRLSAGSPLKKSAIILHPLARGEELAVDLDETPHNWYFAQARGAVYIRMALLTAVTGRTHLVMDAPASAARA